MKKPSPLTPPAYQRLIEILSQPTAPFREIHVQKAIVELLEEGGVPWFQDPVGNLVVGASSIKSYQKLLKTPSQEPLRVMIAHLDHPGFHGTAFRSPLELEVKFHGGTPTAHLDGSPLWLADDQGWLAQGVLQESKLIPSGRALDTGLVELSEPLLRKASARKIFGAFRFSSPVWQEGEILYTKAADDLVGAFAIVELALELFQGRGKPTPFIGLLTRAEEVGFIGAIGHFEKGWLQKAKRPVLCVSLETSRTLPGAEIGKGPVVRLGDRYTVFDPAATRVFTELAERILPGAHQRRVMDGGSCEGTAATVYGFPTVAISVPLGNYHNQSLEGGPDSRGPQGPAPEFVHLQDVSGLLALCRGLMQPRLPWATIWDEKRASFKKMLKRYSPFL